MSGIPLAPEEGHDSTFVVAAEMSGKTKELVAATGFELFQAFVLGIRLDEPSLVFRGESLGITSVTFLEPLVYLVRAIFLKEKINTEKHRGKQKKSKLKETMVKWRR